jgi:hypothetical protein
LTLDQENAVVADRRLLMVCLINGTSRDRHHLPLSGEKAKYLVQLDRLGGTESRRSTIG